MKVYPKRKRDVLKSDEIRVININHTAVDEFLYESLISQSKTLLNLEACTQCFFVMKHNRDEGTLTFAAIPDQYANKITQLDLEYISNLAKKNSSLFIPSPYQKLHITPKMFKSPDTQKGSEDK